MSIFAQKRHQFGIINSPSCYHWPHRALFQRSAVSESSFSLLDSGASLFLFFLTGCCEFFEGFLSETLSFSAPVFAILGLFSMLHLSRGALTLNPLRRLSSATVAPWLTSHSCNRLRWWVGPSHVDQTLIGCQQRQWHVNTGMATSIANRLSPSCRCARLFFLCFSHGPAQQPTNTPGKSPIYASLIKTNYTQMNTSDAFHHVILNLNFAQNYN